MQSCCATGKQNIYKDQQPAPQQIGAGNSHQIPGEWCRPSPAFTNPRVHLPFRQQVRYSPLDCIDSRDVSSSWTPSGRDPITSTTKPPGIPNAPWILPHHRRSRYQRRSTTPQQRTGIIVGCTERLNPNTVKKITIELIYFNITQSRRQAIGEMRREQGMGQFHQARQFGIHRFGTGVLNGVNFGREWTWLDTAKSDTHGTGGEGMAAMERFALTQRLRFHPRKQCPNGTTTSHPTRQAMRRRSPSPGLIVINPQPVPKANRFSLPIAVPPGVVELLRR